MDYYITLPGKKCSKCNNKESIFIIKDGYLICSNCGFIVLSYIPGIDFKPVGFYKPSNIEAFKIECINKFKSGINSFRYNGLTILLEEIEDNKEIIIKP